MYTISLNYAEMEDCLGWTFEQISSDDDATIESDKVKDHSNNDDVSLHLRPFVFLKLRFLTVF